MTDRLHLLPRHRAVLEMLVREHLSGIEVWAYGSRVNGRSHAGSDLDLALRGPDLKTIPADRLAAFEEALRQSSIPFLVAGTGRASRSASTARSSGSMWWCTRREPNAAGRPSTTHARPMGPLRQPWGNWPRFLMASVSQRGREIQRGTCPCSIPTVLLLIMMSHSQVGRLSSSDAQEWWELFITRPHQFGLLTRHFMSRERVLSPLDSNTMLSNP